MEVRPAIPIVMGTNIGTTVTNTIVAVVSFGDREIFQRAFKGATIHDMFNVLSVLVLLPLELASRYLFYLTEAIVDSLDISTDESLNKDLLKKITKPFTNVIIQLDKKVIEKLAKGNEDAETLSLIKKCCGNFVNITSNSTTKYEVVNSTAKNHTVCTKTCKFLFHSTGMSDTGVGVILLILSLIILCVCLVLLVKLIQSLTEGRNGRRFLELFDTGQFPETLEFLSGYLAIIVGIGLTILVQSSSVFTSAVTPLIGRGLVSLDTFYPLTLGSNIGTTVTGILAAFATDSEKLKSALQIALCHLFFNISGIIIWYPIPPMREIPKKLAEKLGEIAAKYRWFSVVYLFSVFLVFPGIILGLSLAGWEVLAGIMIPVIVFVLIIVVINIIQVFKKHWLPVRLQDWEWLPQPLRSLEPYDSKIQQLKNRIRNLRN